MKRFFMKGLASDKTFYSGYCLKVILPATDGQKEILGGHENMVMAVTEGILKYQAEEDGEWTKLAVGSGFAQIINNRVTILVDTAERPEEIDVRRAEEAKERAQEQLRQKQSIQEYHISRAALARAMSRLKAANRR